MSLPRTATYLGLCFAAVHVPLRAERAFCPQELIFPWAPKKALLQRPVDLQSEDGAAFFTGISELNLSQGTEVEADHPLIRGKKHVMRLRIDRTQIRTNLLVDVISSHLQIFDPRHDSALESGHASHHQIEISASARGDVALDFGVLAESSGTHQATVLVFSKSDSKPARFVAEAKITFRVED